MVHAMAQFNNVCYFLQSYYKWILNMGNLTDGALKWSLRDSRAAIVEAAAQNSDPTQRHALLHEPFAQYNEYFRRCDVEYHPGESCVTAHACK